MACIFPVRAKLSWTSAHMQSHRFSFFFKATRKLLLIPTHSYKIIRCPRYHAKTIPMRHPHLGQKKVLFRCEMASACSLRAVQAAFAPRGCGCIREMASTE